MLEIFDTSVFRPLVLTVVPLVVVTTYIQKGNTRMTMPYCSTAAPRFSTRRISPCRIMIVLVWLLSYPQFLYISSSISSSSSTNHRNSRIPVLSVVLVHGYVATTDQRWRQVSQSVVSNSQLSRREYIHWNSPTLFVSPSNRQRQRSIRTVQLYENKSDSKQEQVVRLDIKLTDDRIRKLYAWICQAFYGNDDRYNNLMYAMVAVFGNLPSDSPIMALLHRAVQSFDSSIDANECMGDALSQYERERASLGAMGAAQWMGQWKTRPHALLDISNYTSIQDWEKSLPRGCKRTIQRAVLAEQANFTVVSQPIRHNHPAPHSTYEHFKCVVQHEVRLLSNMYGTPYGSEDDDSNSDDEYDKVSVMLNALSEAISRYMGTTQMTGLIREYRCRTSQEVIAFAHEVRKGQTIRGQWFYATDTAAKQYVWFHSVRSLIERAIEENNSHASNDTNSTTGTSVQNSTTTATAASAAAAAKSLFPFLNPPSRHSPPSPPRITIVDLGPSGSDDFSDLKSKYGFQSMDDWPSIANYHGPFWDYSTNAPVKNGVKD